MKNAIVTAWKISNRGLDEDYKPAPDLYVYECGDGTGGVRLPDGTEWFRTKVKFAAEPKSYLGEPGTTVEPINPASLPPSARS